MADLGPIVLVHGYWHGSWCWTAVTEELATRGMASVAVDLAGHGLDARSPAARWKRPFDAAAYATEPTPYAASVTASSAAERLAGQVRRIGRGRPCLIVAHDMGGTVATALAELAPELIAGLVYVTAFAPTGGRNTGQLIQLPENAGSTVHSRLAAEFTVVGALRFDTCDAGRHADLIETFYADVPAEQAKAAIGMLSPDAPVGIATEPIDPTAKRFGRLPHTYVVCTRDKAVDPTLQRLMIADIDALSAEPTTVVELECSHSPFFSQPAALVDVLEKAQQAAAARHPSPRPV